jgi:hypothetical protein
MTPCSNYLIGARHRGRLLKIRDTGSVMHGLALALAEHFREALGSRLLGACRPKGGSPMRIEFDHVFICTTPEAPEAERLVQFALREGPPNQHPGQGKACLGE